MDGEATIAAIVRLAGKQQHHLHGLSPSNHIPVPAPVLLAPPLCLRKSKRPRLGFLRITELGEEDEHDTKDKKQDLDELGCNNCRTHPPDICLY